VLFENNAIKFNYLNGQSKDFDQIEIQKSKGRLSSHEIEH